MLGIETIKKDLSILMTIGKKIDNALEDSKISVIEGFGIAISAVKIWEIAKNAKDLIAEYKDLDEAEKAELIEFFETEFDLRNDTIEGYIEKAFELLITMAEYITLFDE